MNVKANEFFIQVKLLNVDLHRISGSNKVCFHFYISFSFKFARCEIASSERGFNLNHNHNHNQILLWLTEFGLNLNMLN